jgi:uncharacterized protein
MTHNEIIEKVTTFVQQQMDDTDPGHDLWHVNRVWKMARHIAQNYNVNHLLVDLGALLHDVADAKFHDGNEEMGPALAKQLLESLQIEQEIIVKTIEIIKHISFKNKDSGQPDFMEFKIIQDADRLDAMGAIGIARAFSYGGYKKREMYNPEIKPVKDFQKETYKNGREPTINHFYEKLLTLKDLMNTKEAKKMAEKRHQFMLAYLEMFFKEWNSGKM